MAQGPAQRRPQSDKKRYQPKVIAENRRARFDYFLDAPVEAGIALVGTEIKALRAGQRIDNSDYMCKSTLMALMIRMSAYSGQTVSWDQALASEEDLTPPAYEWGPIETPPVAIPGVTKFL